jgi:hypothetical protein
MKHNPSSKKITFTSTLTSTLTLTLTLTLTFAFLGNTLFAQDISQWAESQKTALYEKVYLHIDREFYSPGDTLWFKSYLTGGLDNKLEPGYKNIYVQLVSPTGKVISNRLLMSMFGEANGDFALVDSLPGGQYTVRAYTKYQENFGEESYFHKRVWIAKSKSLFEPQLPNPEGTQTTNSNLPKPAEAQPIDVMFFPAGGNLVLNAANHVAFKAIDTSGKGVEVSGKVVDETGQVITTFQTSFLGLGEFIFMPQEGKTYFAEIDNHPDFRYKFDKILENGVTLNFRDNGNEVLVSLSRNIKSTGQQTFYLAATHKGVVLFHREILIDGFSQAVKLGKNFFPRGITKLTLLDTAMNVVSERLVFIDQYNQSSARIGLEKEKFATREKVDLSVEPFFTPGDSMASTLSIAVVNEDYFSSGGNNQTIESYLLVDSELKGAIESPTSYFYDGDSISSAEKLDLLMMVQGWRSYYWDEILEKAPKDMAGWGDAGVTVEGAVKRLFGSKPIIGGEVVLGPYSHFLYEKTKTDSLGRFRFERLYLKDSSNITINAKTQSGGKNVGITLDPILEYSANLDTIPINKAVGLIGIPQKYYSKIEYKLMAEKEFDPGIGSILLEGVDIFARRINNFTQVEAYKPSAYLADDSYLITKEDYKYGDVHDFLRDKLGFNVDSWAFCSMTGATYNVIQYMVDGEFIPAVLTPNADKDESYKALSIAMKDVYQIDVQLSPWPRIPVRALTYIYTKKLDQKEAYSPTAWGRIEKQVNGFQKPHKFYSPKYSLENINSKTPDYRPTLFWSPSVVVEDGKANLEFYTCDNLGSYVVIVEGISKNGKIISGAKRFSVTGFNTSLKK